MIIMVFKLFKFNALTQFFQGVFSSDGVFARVQIIFPETSTHGWKSCRSKEIHKAASGLFC